MASEQRAYRSDLTDREWQRLEPLLPCPRVIGRPRRVDLREVCNAILYVLDTGSRWRELPPDLVPWHTAYWWFRAWQQDGTLARITATLARESCPVAVAAIDHREPALAAR